MYQSKSKKSPSSKDSSAGQIGQETPQSKSPPPFQLQASNEAPAQMFLGGIGDAISKGWDALTGGDKEEKEKEAAEKDNAEVAAEVEQEETAQSVLPPAGVFEVTDAKAYTRTGPPEFKVSWPRNTIYQGAKVRIVESMTVGGKQYSKLVQDMGDTVGPPAMFGWTAHSNLTLSTPPDKEEVEANEAAFEKQAEKQEEKAASGDFEKGVEQQYELDEEHAALKGGDEWNGTTYNNFLLEHAGIDTDSFWSEFTSIDLFGKPATSLHKDFANLLKNVERLTVEKVVASEDFKAWQAEQKKTGTDAKTVGKFLGISYYSTIRSQDQNSTSSSFHMYGMAIDFNANNNPWISDSSGTMGEIKSGKLKGVRTKTQQLQDCLDRIGQLTKQTLNFEHVNPDSDKYDMMSMFDNSDVMDKSFEKYFSLQDEGNQAELEKFLATAGPPWTGLSAEDARKIIVQDFEDMTALWSRSNQKATTKKHGIMDLDRRLVQSMNAMGLDWGGKYGDMMHFDMRFLGKGAKIRQAKNSKEGRAKKKEMGG